MTNMDVSQLVSCIAYLKCYLEETVSQCNTFRDLNEQKDVKIDEMHAKIETLENEIVNQNNEINELKDYLENNLKESDNEDKIVKAIASNDDLKKCQDEMIIILKERCDDLNAQLTTTRQAWHEKCTLIERYRRELTDVGDQISVVHRKLSDMKIWQKQMEMFYTALKENQEHIQMAASEDNVRITSEITDLKRIQNELILNDEIKDNAPMSGTGDGIDKGDRKMYRMNQVTLERNQTVNRIEIFSNMAEINQIELMKQPNAVVSSSSMGFRFLKNLDFFDSFKSKFQKIMLQLTGYDKKTKNDSLVRYGLPATIVCCFVTGTLLTQMIFSPTNNKFSVSHMTGSKGFVLSAPFRK